MSVLPVPLVLAGFGAAGGWGYAVAFGLGNGIMTIAIGTLPLLLFGPTGYGHRQGLLMVPARLLQAAAPFLFGLCVERWGLNALWLTALLALTAAITLACLRAPRRDGEPAP